MANPVNFFLPPDNRDAEKRRALADMLQGKALSPMQGPQQLGPVASKMHWGEGIAKLGEAFLARHAGKKADEADQTYRNEVAKRFGVGTDPMTDALVQSRGHEEQKRRMLAAQLTGEPIDGAPALDSQRLGSNQAQYPSLGLPPELAMQLYLQNPGGYMAAAAESQKPQPLQWKDAGDAWVALDAQGQEVQRVAKGATPDAQLGAQTTTRGQDLRYDASTMGHDVTMRGQDLTAGTTRRGQDISAATTQRGQDISAETSRRGQDFIAALAADKQGMEVDEKAKESVTAWNTYQTARDHLMSSLDATSTGPMAGRMPAFTAAQQTADSANAAMAPVLKSLFRQAGEGIFTDKDQELLLAMIADRTLEPQARIDAMRNVDQIVMSKLGLSQPAESDPLSALTPEQRAKYGL